jgi:gamma-glutamyltranspeptidase/glutathione hydrolase
LGGQANAIEPGKRPLSSMSPTFVETARGVAVLGTRGGSRIINMVLLGILEYLKGGNAQAIVDRLRFHHQYLPDQVRYEHGAFSQSTLDALTRMGYVLRESKGGYGNMQAVVWDWTKGTLTAASDPLLGDGEAPADAVRMSDRPKVGGGFWLGLHAARRGRGGNVRELLGRAVSTASLL